jgi:hypothetical protein
MYLGKSLQSGGNHQGTINLGLRHFRADVFHASGQFGEIDVAVGVNEHGQ